MHVCMCACVCSYLAIIFCEPVDIAGWFLCGVAALLSSQCLQPSTETHIHLHFPIMAHHTASLPSIATRFITLGERDQGRRGREEGKREEGEEGRRGGGGEGGEGVINHSTIRE